MSASVADRLAALVAFAEGMAEGDCAYGDGCPPFGTRHGQCRMCAARAVLKAWNDRPWLRHDENAVSVVSAVLFRGLGLGVGELARLTVGVLDGVDDAFGPRTTATESRCPCGWSGKESEREQKMNDTLCPRCRRAEPRRDGQLKVSVAGPRTSTTEGSEPR